MPPIADVVTVVVMLYGFRLGTLLGLFDPRVIAGVIVFHVVI